MKGKYDLKTEVRTFQEGDKILVYFPVPGSPLSAKYHGPYTIKSKVSMSVYIINASDRRKATQMVHIILLKPYLTQEPAPDLPRLPCNVMYRNKDDYSNSEILQEMPKFLAPLTSTKM